MASLANSCRSPRPMPQDPKAIHGADFNPDTLVQNLPLSVQQWIVIARALLANPRMLILDESSAALDLDATARLHAEIRQLRDDGCCVVIVTHRIAELIRVADRATVLRDGAVVGELVGPYINGTNLLGMMSAKQVILETKAKPPPSTERLARDILLSARGISVGPSAPRFDFDLHAGEIVGACWTRRAGPWRLSSGCSGSASAVLGKHICGRSQRSKAGSRSFRGHRGRHCLHFGRSCA